MRPMGGEYDQSTLYACMKCHYEANYFVQLTYANKKEFMGEQASENPVSEHELEGGHRSGLGNSASCTSTFTGIYLGPLLLTSLLL
jgi:phosphomevalonate kinase